MNQAPQRITICSPDDPTSKVCPSCGSSGLRVFYSSTNVPVHSAVVLNNRDEALAFPRGDIRLALCDACGAVTNAEYDSTAQDYRLSYEESQGYSATFSAYADDLARRLIKRFNLRGKVILELGCGKGSFLASLCRLGDNQGIAIDPAYVPERMSSDDRRRIHGVCEYFSDDHADLVRRANFICCRHTLEHIGSNLEFVSRLRRLMGDRLDTPVIFDIPDGERVLKTGAFWDIYYEHCSYFSAGSLARLFRAAGFEVTDVHREYGDQYLIIEARPGAGVGANDFAPMPIEESPGAMCLTIDRFHTRVVENLEAARAMARLASSRSVRTVLWGSGSRAVAYLTSLGCDEHDVEAVIDINPHRQGRFMPGVPQPIIAPERLVDLAPDRVIVMNPIYRDEIARSLDQLGLRATLLTV